VKKVAEKTFAIPTPGRVHHIGQYVRFYYKPALQKVVIRKSGVLRKSAKVLAINKKFAEIKPAAACKGQRPWHKFVMCLSEQLKGKLKT